MLVGLWSAACPPDINDGGATDRSARDATPHITVTTEVALPFLRGIAEGVVNHPRLSPLLAEIDVVGHHVPCPSVLDTKLDVVVLVGRQPVPGCRAGNRVAVHGEDDVAWLKPYPRRWAIRRYRSNSNSLIGHVKVNPQVLFLRR